MPSRAIVFNGTTQNAKVTLPNAAPWTSMGPFKFVFKIRGITQAGYFFYIPTLGYVFLNADGVPQRVDFSEPGVADIYHVPSDYADLIVKLQFDPANSRWTIETWKTDGTGRTVSTYTISNTNNRNLGGKDLFFASNEYSVAKSACKIDWFYMQSGVEALNVFPGAEATSSATLLRYDFDSDNGNDSSGNGLNLTLYGTPTFEDTPGGGGGTVTDTYTDTNDTNLQSHTGENSLTWGHHTNGQNNAVIHTNRLTKDNQAGAALYYADASVPDNGYVQGTVGMLTSINVNVGLVARLAVGSDDYYVVRHNQSTNEWQLRKTVAGTASSLQTWSETLNPGDSRLVRFEFNGSSLKVFIAGVERLSVSDSAHTTGKSGFRFSGAASTSTGYYIDNFESGPLGGGSAPAPPSNLSLNAVSPTQVDMSWADNASDETSFRVERKTGAGGTYAEIGSNAANITAFSDTTAVASTTYYYRVRARNAVGDSAYLTEQSVTTPATGTPNPPSGLSLNAVAPTQVNLSWVDNSSNETSFRVERKTGAGGTYAEIGSVAAGVVVYSDNTVSTGTTYFYRVRARNGAGDSAYTAEQSVTTSATGPTAPTNLVLTVISGREVKLLWTDNSSDETLFRIERKTGAGGVYAEIATVGANTTSHIDTTANVSTTYFYRVRASHATGSSAYLTEQSVTTPRTISIYQANVQHGVGTDGLTNYARQLNYLLPGVDIIAVQEKGTTDTGWNAGLTAAGFVQAVYLENSPNQGDGPAIWYNTATTTLHAVFSHKLSTNAIGWDGSTNVDKAAVGARVTVAGKSFYIFVTHLAWSAGADSNGSLYSAIRVAQIKEFLTWKNSIVGSDPNYFIFGDLNFGPDYPREQIFTANASTDVLTSTAHGWKDGAAVTVRNVGGALPGALAAATTYYVRDVTPGSPNTLKLSTTPGGAAINITSNGTGTNYLVGLQMDLFSGEHTDLWLEGIATGKATAAWGDRNSDGTPDMPITNLTTRTHDTRRIDYALISKTAAQLALRLIDLPDQRAVCPHALVAGGTLPSCSPEVTGGPGVAGQQWDTPDDFGVRPSDHNWFKVVMDVNEVTSSNANITFVAGPQLPIAEGNAWFNSTQTSKAIVHGDACPISPPTDEAGANSFVLLHYYDLAKSEYNTYLRTNNTLYLDYFRKAADAWWKIDWINQGLERDFGNGRGPSPRHAGIGGLILRAIDGRPEMWDWIQDYTRAAFDNWVKSRINNAKLYYGLREGAFMLHFAAWLAKVLPDSFPLQAGGTATNGAAIRAGFLADIENVVVNYFGRLQYPDGSWRWDSATDEFVSDDGGTMLNTMQPFMVGLYLNALVDVDQLPISAAARTSVRNQLTSACTHLYSGGPYRISEPVAGWSGKFWRSFWYFYHGGTSVNPTRWVNGGGSYIDLTDGSWVVSSERQSNAIILPPFAYAYKITGNTLFRDAFDELVDATYTGTDEIRSLMDGTAKNWNQHLRRGGSGFFWRQFSTSNVSPAVNAGSDQSLAAATTSTTLTGSAFDADGDTLTLAWTRVSGPNTPTIVTPTALTTNITGMVTGTYVFRLTANDGVNPSVYDEVQVTIVPANSPPVVNAGSNQNLAAGTTSATLTGTVTDPDGDTTTKTWSRVSGPNTPTIVSPNALSTSVTGMVAGTYVFRLTGNDGVNANVTDDVQVVIASANAQPTVNAGVDQNLPAASTSTTVNGTANDPEGAPLSSTWTRISGPNTPTIVTPNALSTSITGLVAGTYVFRLTVSDGETANVSDDIQIVVASGLVPNVTAGDKLLPFNSNKTTLKASATNVSGAATKQWTQLSGPNTAVISTPTAWNTNISNLVSGTYVFRFTITDGPVSVSDDVTVVKLPHSRKLGEE